MNIRTWNTDNGNTLFDSLGSFWTDFYLDNEAVRSYIQGKYESYLQAEQDFTEYAKAIGILTVPSKHIERWHYQTITNDTILENSTLTYDQDDGLGVIVDSILNDSTYDWDTPTDLNYSSCIIDNIKNPTIVWVYGVDYFIENSRLRFVKDPFKYFPVNNTYDDNGTIILKTIKLIHSQAEFGVNFIKEQFGYLLNFYLDPSDNYSNIIKALWFTYRIGPCLGRLENILAAALDVPIIKTSGTIKKIYIEKDRKIVVTDSEVYFTTYDATLVVSVGDNVVAGDRITDAYTIIPTIPIPDSSILSSFSVPSSLFNITLIGDLTWSNSDQPTTVTTVSSRTKIVWPLSGDTGDVDDFWNQVHTNGIAVGATSLAQLLDLRPAGSSGDPDENSLPTLINPMEFLFNNILGPHSIIIKLNSTSYGSNALDSTTLNKLLRLVTSPQNTIFLI